MAGLPSGKPQAGYNVLNAVVDYDINHEKEAKKHPERFYIEMYYDKRIPDNKLGKQVRVNYDLS